MKNKALSQPTLEDRAYAAQVEARIRELEPRALHEQILFAKNYLCACGQISEELRDALIPVAITAQGTVFIEDYDYTKDGLGLSQLASYSRKPELRPQLVASLKKLTYFTGCSINDHLEDFARLTGLTELVAKTAVAA